MKGAAFRKNWGRLLIGINQVRLRATRYLRGLLIYRAKVRSIR